MIARVAEARDLVVAADHQAQRRGDVLRVDAEVGRALAVDLHAQLGLVQLERGVGIDDAELRRALAQLLGVLGERLEVRPADGEVDARTGRRRG